MTVLQSNDKYYEFDPSTSSIREDVWGKYYQGKCKTASATKDVLIYKFGTKYHRFEYLLRRLNVKSHFCISHPNIIPIIDFVAVRDDSQSDDFQLYFIEEDFIGVTLADFLQGKICDSEGHDVRQIKELYSLYRRDSVAFARKIVHDILQGLDFLHGSGLYIRCFDPEWIFITAGGDAKITAKHCHFCEIVACNRHHLRIMDSFIGCLSGQYLSPEFIQYEDPMKIDYRSDIYSVGILLFRLLTGHCPYRGQNTEVLYQHVNGKIPLHEIKDKPLRRIVKKATEKNPVKRYQSAKEFVVVLEDYENVHISWHKKVYSFFSISNIKVILTDSFLSILLFILFCSKYFAQIQYE